MPITFRHDAAAVVPPSNQTTRKYGQQLVLQQNQQKYAAQQQGYDRLFTLGRDAMQSQNQAIMQGQQNAARAIANATQFANDQTLQETQNKFLTEQQQRQQRDADFKAARGRMDAYAKDALNNPDLQPELRQKIQNLISGKMTALGGGFDGPAQQEFLDQYNAQLAALLSEVPPPKPKAPPQPSFHTDQDGNRWVEAGPGKWNQVPKEEKPPMSAQEYYGNPKNEDKFQKDLSAKMQAMQDEQDLITDPAKRTPVTKESAWAQMQKDYEFRNNALGRRQPTPSSAAGYGSSSAAYYSPDSGTEQTPDQGSAQPQIALGPGHPDYKAPPTPTDQKDAQGYVIMSDGSKIDPRDSAAMKSGGGMTQDVMRMTNPDGSSIEQSTLGAVEEMGAAQKKQVKVGGKPLAVTPGALTPQETEAKNSFMQLPREQRIAALMPYEPSLKGKTLEQLLEDPETKAGYAELAKQGLTTGNYREDMLGHLDEMLQNNVLNAGSKPDAYVGMNVNDVTDPKAKAELEKLPRPKSGEEMKTIRGSFFVDPNGVVRSTQKQV